MFSSSRESLKSSSEPELEILSDEELVKLVEDLKVKVTLLRLDNEVLEESILRLQPALMNGVNQVLEYAMKIQSGLALTSKMSKFGLNESVYSNLNIKSHHHLRSESLGRVASSGKVSSTLKLTSSGKLAASSKTANSIIISKSIIGGHGPKVNVEEKLELVYALIECQLKALEKCKNNAMKQKAYLKAQFEEIDLRITDIDKLVVDFDQQVVIDGLDPISHRIPAEIWIRFLTEQAKKIDRKMDKLRIRVSTLNIKFKKLKDEMRRKGDLRSRLTPVDFEIKQMEIKENIDTIDFKSKEVVALKEMTGDANLSLTIHKKQMMAMEKYVEEIHKLKAQREQQTVKINAQRDSLQLQVDILQECVNEIKEMRETYFVPNVMDYVQVKVKLGELNHAIKHLETRLKIQKSNVVMCKRERRRKSEMLLSEETSDTTNSDSIEMLLKITRL